MAKSFYTILDEGRIEVSHKGNDVELELPAWLAEAASKLEEEQELLTWAQENEVLHGLLHAGIQQVIIQMRAAARPGEEVSILDDKTGAQQRLDEYVCKPVNRPGTGSRKKVDVELYKASVKTAIAMQSAGVDIATIKSVLSSNHDSVTVARIMNEIAVD